MWSDYCQAQFVFFWGGSVGFEVEGCEHFVYWEGTF